MLYHNVNGRMDGKGVGNVGIRCECASSDCWPEDENCQDTEAETNDVNGEQSKASDCKKESNSVNFTCTCFLIFSFTHLLVRVCN